MSFVEMIFLIPIIMLSIAIYIAFDIIVTIAFDDYEENKKED